MNNETSIRETSRLCMKSFPKIGPCSGLKRSKVKNKIPARIQLSSGFVLLCAGSSNIVGRKKLSRRRILLLSDEHFFYRCLNRNLCLFRQFENRSLLHQIDRLIIYYYYTNFNLKDIRKDLIYDFLSTSKLLLIGYKYLKYYNQR